MSVKSFRQLEEISRKGSEQLQGRGQGSGLSKWPVPAAHHNVAPEGAENCKAHQEGEVDRMHSSIQNNGNQLQQGSRKRSLEFRNSAPYAASGFRGTVEDKKILRLRGMIAGMVVMLSVVTPNMEQGASE